MILPDEVVLYTNPDTITCVGSVRQLGGGWVMYVVDGRSAVEVMDKLQMYVLMHQDWMLWSILCYQ